jgi:D-alanine-D-alanine ligase
MKIAIITGGETGERDISIKSAQNVLNLIDFATVETFTFPEDRENFLLSVNTFDLAIPVIHGAGGEDGTLQFLLENLKIPYLFSGIETHQIAIDKRATKEVASNLGITSPKETSSFPLFAKPKFGGSSVSSQLCVSLEELNILIKTNQNIELIKEEPIKGREFTVGVIEYQNKTFTLPVIEIIPKGEFFDFENKYNPEKLATEICPAKIPDSLSEELQRQSLLIHSHLKVKHISRSDFIVTPDEKIYFLEINTIPGMTNTSLLPKMLEQEGLSLKELFKEWCNTVYKT